MKHIVITELHGVHCSLSMETENIRKLLKMAFEQLFQSFRRRFTQVDSSIVDTVETSCVKATETLPDPLTAVEVGAGYGMYCCIYREHLLWTEIVYSTQPHKGIVDQSSELTVDWYGKPKEERCN